MHKIPNEGERIVIYAVKIAMSLAKHGRSEHADEVSALLSECGIAKADSAIVDWRYDGEEYTVIAPAHLAENEVFGLSPVLFVVMSRLEDDIYWSNETGWGSREDATVFTQEEANDYILPMGGQWLPTANAGQETR